VFFGPWRILSGILVFLLCSPANVSAQKTLAEIESLIRTQIIQYATQSPDITTKDVKVKILPLKNSDQFPYHASQISLKIPKKARLGGSQVFPLVFIDDKKIEIYQTQVNVDITIFGKVFKASERIEKGTILEPHLIDQSYESINSLPENRVRHIDEIMGSETTVSLYQGTPITPYQIRKVPLIRTGQIINARIQKQGFTITVKAKAIDRGFLGQKLQAKTLNYNGKLVEGTVINNETIEVNSLY